MLNDRTTEPPITGPLDLSLARQVAYRAELRAHALARLAKPNPAIDSALLAACSATIQTLANACGEYDELIATATDTLRGVASAVRESHPIDAPPSDA